jgi:Flp pilus assembly pilin Flp
MLEYLFHVVRERLYAEERGQSFIEYSLLIALIALAVIGLVTFTDLGTSIANVFTEVRNSIDDVLAG